MKCRPAPILPDRGSEFLVKLPLMRIPKANESPTSDSTPATNDAPLRILVVDDNRDSAETLSLLLELMGNEMSVAYDGEQALAMANEIKPDVVLLDIGLPKINGYEVARLIRQRTMGSQSDARRHYRLGTDRRQRSFPRIGLRSSSRETCRPRSLTKAHSERKSALNVGQQQIGILVPNAAFTYARKPCAETVSRR